MKKNTLLFSLLAVAVLAGSQVFSADNKIVDKLLQTFKPTTAQTTAAKTKSTGAAKTKEKKINKKYKIIENCLVSRVPDGDTITCKTPDHTTYKVRFFGIDAPESKQDYGPQSGAALSKLIYNKKVKLEQFDVDHYGRVVAYVYLDSLNLNKYQLANGNAWVYKEYTKDQELYALEAAAKSKKLGLWKAKNPQYPSDFRKQKKK